MCGIGGSVAPAGQLPPPAALAAMRDAMAHRGPDGSGVQVVGNVGLVHTRLAIVDVTDHAAQPMAHPSGRWWLAFNGEIYNHRRLRGELGGARFRSGSDTETLLHAFARWGPAVLPRLNGQFAFAALDLDRNRLWLARDRFGIKPLYLARNGPDLWWASEPAALLAAGVRSAPRCGSWQTLFDLSCYWDDGTLVEGIHRLLPGSLAEVDLDTGELTVSSWASPSDFLDETRQASLQGRSRRGLVDELETTLRDAVHEALLGDVPMGVLCSGGVDSSLVTALAREEQPGLVAFAARYRGAAGLDEGPAAALVADALGTELDLLEVTREGWRAGFVTSTLHFGMPLANASSVVIAQLAQRARRRGVKVLLTGEGADELFGGYSRASSAHLREFLSPGQRAALTLHDVALSPPQRTAVAVARRLRRRGPGTAPGRAWRWDVRHPPSPGTGGVEGPSAGESYAHHPGPRGRYESLLLQDFQVTLGHLLNRMDTNMMQESVEARVPFLDPRLVGLALNLPLEARTLPWNKGILRDVARRHLPLRIAHRPKVYGMIFDAGSWIEEAARPGFLLDGVFGATFGLRADDLRSLAAGARGSDRVRLWSAEVWCRAVFAGQSASAIEAALWA